ncbi:MAG: NADPH-dependent oxidoreductase [Beijerinckiaceae bacterium]
MSGSLAKAERRENEPGGKAFDLARQRYRQDDAPVPNAWNDTLETLVSHRSVRAYLPDPLPAGTIETLVTAAQSASSSANLQVWSVVAVEDAARKARLAALAGNQKHIVQAPLFLVWLLDLARLEAMAQERSRAAEGLAYIDSFVVGAVDTSLAAQNALVAAESLGLGCVYIGGIRNKPVDVAAELGLPPNVLAIVGLVVGYPDPAVRTGIKPRLPQEAVLHRERYAWGPAQRAAVEDYNARLRSFQEEQGMPLQDWSDLALNRMKGAPNLSGRDKLRDALTALGFGLR